MNADVAGRAVLITWIGHVMRSSLRRDAGAVQAEIPGPIVTFQAQGEHHRTPQQPRVRGAMRYMTGLASLHADRWVFEHKRSAFLRVAFLAGLFIRQPLFHHARTGSHSPRGHERAMRVVAIGALHEAFIDAMLEGHGELRAHILVAAIAEVGLHGRQQESRSRRFMNGVATGARHAVQRVTGAPNVGARDALAMAGQTVVQDLVRSELRESDDGGLGGRFDVRPTGTVAAFATLVRGAGLLI